MTLDFRPTMHQLRHGAATNRGEELEKALTDDSGEKDRFGPTRPMRYLGTGVVWAKRTGIETKFNVIIVQAAP